MIGPQRLLGLPRRWWLGISPALIAAAAVVPLPGPPADPSAGLFGEPVLIAHVPDWDVPPPDGPAPDPIAEDGQPRGGRVVPFDRREWTGPVFAMGLQSTDRATVRRGLGWSRGSTLPELGFFRRRDDWRYELTAVRFDEGSRRVPPDRLWLPAGEVAALRPRVVAELDRRSAPGGEGARLMRLLDVGAASDTVLNWQNLAVLAAWLSIPPALLAAFPPRAAGKPKAAAAEMREAFP